MPFIYVYLLTWTFSIFIQCIIFFVFKASLKYRIPKDTKLTSSPVETAPNCACPVNWPSGGVLRRKWKWAEKAALSAAARGLESCSGHSPQFAKHQRSRCATDYISRQICGAGPRRWRVGTAFLRACGRRLITLPHHCTRGVVIMKIRRIKWLVLCKLLAVCLTWTG